MAQAQQAVRAITYVQAVNEALRQELERDPTVFIMGEDIAGGAGRADKEDAWGGPFRLTKGLIGDFGPERIRDTPISEAGFMGAGVGAAASGMRPVVDLMFVGFLGVCGDQIFNNAAKMHYMFGGKVNIPLTIMTSTGAGTASAAQHSETLYSVFAHFPGLKCVVPSDPYTAKGLFISAIRDDDPVIIFNHKLLMGRTPTPQMTDGAGYGGHVPEEPYEFPIGKAMVAREGTDVTLLGVGYTTLVCQEAAEMLVAQGYSPEVIDLLSVSPLDEQTILDSVMKTRKIVIVDEDYPRCSVASDISALVAEEAFDYLDAPPKRVTSPHTSVPYSLPLEMAFLPSKERVYEAAMSVLE
jgi:pyruvate/2-oxoglutarate/acetoin dehydrogenase E1 component